MVSVVDFVALVLNVMVNWVMDMYNIQTSDALNKISICKEQPMYEGVQEIHLKLFLIISSRISPYCPLNLI